MRIGIDLGGTKIEAVALDDQGQVCYRKRVDTPRGDYDATLNVIATLVEEIEHATNRPGSVGIGIPGAISPATIRVKNANSTWLIGQALQTDLETRLARPIRIENDANCFTVSEAADGAARDARVVFGVIVGTGTGGGIVVDGQLLTGINAVAGEWGHNPLPWPSDEERPGPKCYCGKHGCIETFLSGPGLSHEFSLQAGIQTDAPSIVKMAHDGEPQAEAALQRYEHRMARALAGVINILDPDIIVLGGGMSNIHRLYKNVPQIWSDYVFSDHVATALRPPAHGDSSGVRGAAWLWPA